METERIIDEIGKEQGWNDHSKLQLALEYIDNQGDNAAFREYLERVQQEENLDFTDEETVTGED